MSDFQNMPLHQSGYRDRAAAARQVYQRVMAALSWPGSCQQLSLPDDKPDGLPAVAAALMLALCDSDTPVHLPESLRASRWCATWLRLHCQTSTVADPSAARYLLCRRGDALPVGANGCLHADVSTGQTKKHGDVADRTLLLEVASLREGLPLHIHCDGERERQVVVRVDGLPVDLLGSRARQEANLPLDIDVIAFDSNAIVALPRGVRLSVALDPFTAQTLPDAARA